MISALALAVSLAAAAPATAPQPMDIRTVALPPAAPPPPPPPPPAAFVAAPVPPQPRGVRTPPVALNAGDWIKSEDYPPSALRNEETGLVQFLLKIGTDGRVIDCSVMASSASPVLEAQTCRLILLRGQFTPARDKKRKPVVGTYSARVRWTLPE